MSLQACESKPVVSTSHSAAMTATSTTPRAAMRLSASLTGNLGGYDTKADPDTFLDTYTRQRDNVYRGGVTLGGDGDCAGDGDCEEDCDGDLLIAGGVSFLFVAGTGLSS